MSQIAVKVCMRIELTCALFLFTTGDVGSTPAQRTRRLLQPPAARLPALPAFHAALTHLLRGQLDRLGGFTLDRSQRASGSGERAASGGERESGETLPRPC
jgi:hypothetical protein